MRLLLQMRNHLRKLSKTIYHAEPHLIISNRIKITYSFLLSFPVFIQNVV